MHGLPPPRHRPRPTRQRPIPQAATNPRAAPTSQAATGPIRVLAYSAQFSTRTPHSAQDGRSASVNDAAVTTCPHRAMTRPLRARSRPINSSLTRWVYPSPQHATATQPGPPWSGPSPDPARRLTTPPLSDRPREPKDASMPAPPPACNRRCTCTRTRGRLIAVEPLTATGESVASRARPGRTRATPSDPFEETGARRPGHDRRAGQGLLRAAGCTRGCLTGPPRTKDAMSADDATPIYSAGPNSGRSPATRRRARGPHWRSSNVNDPTIGAHEPRSTLPRRSRMVASSPRVAGQRWVRARGRHTGAAQETRDAGQADSRSPTTRARKPAPAVGLLRMPSARPLCGVLGERPGPRSRVSAIGALNSAIGSTRACGYRRPGALVSERAEE